MTHTWDDTVRVDTTEGSTRAVPRAHWAALPLRLMLGFSMMFHGFPKLFSAEGHRGFVGMLDGLGVPAPGFMAWAVGVLEFFGGLALIIGALVVPISLLFILHQIVALVLVHLPHGYNFQNIQGQTPAGPVYGPPGFEVNLLYIAAFLSLALIGPGPLSLDSGARNVREKPEPDYVGARQPPI